MTKKEKQKQFLSHFRDSHGIVSFACQQVGITRSCYYKWRENDPKFREKADEIEEETIDHVESKLYNAIDKGDLTAIIFYLKTKGKKRGYVEKAEQSISVKEVRTEMSREEIIDELERLERLRDEQ
ncbi:phBC6A51 family helix-turn-helix protein [Caecibacteroides pullorum]|uniref:Homeodomain phBC6A51-type domain-containing protein n=1 Tax=Caecibacteroides pullorum TaxID=2725562 RepID=A0AA41D7A3_9BACT|nr:phBC6A51 family helix-turn-helix protein [Caecibacteroides pullorum]MBM6856516.1 hypothetical protein [Caecibacteroides pullorum]MBV8057522.1 hypothetical protein [Caecibacteroides pullorum]